MRTRILRITATAGATALLVTVGAVALAGSASAATAQKSTAIAAHDMECRMGSGSDHPMMCHFDDDDGLVGNLLDVLLGED